MDTWAALGFAVEGNGTMRIGLVVAGGGAGGSVVRAMVEGLGFAWKAGLRELILAVHVSVSIGVVDHLARR